MKNKDNGTLQKKILKGMDKIQSKLIAYKKSINSELVVLENDKVVKIKP